MISSASSTSPGPGVPNDKPATGRRLHGAHHRRVGVAQDHRPPRPDEVDVLPTVGIGESGARGGHHEPWRSADRAEGPDRGVDPAGGDRAGPGEPGGAGRRRRVDVPVVVAPNVAGSVTVVSVAGSVTAVPPRPAAAAPVRPPSSSARSRPRPGGSR